MKIKGTKIRNINQLNRNTLYSVPSSNIIPFEEQQEDGTKDLVQLRYNLSENDAGFYGSEYRPGFLAKSDCKAVDILAMVTNDEQKKVTSYLYDVKRTIGGEDVIYHFVEQIQDSLLHKQAMIQYLDGYQEKEHLGVVTAMFDELRIESSINEKKESLSKNDTTSMAPMLASKIEGINLRIKKELSILENFQQRKIEFQQKLHNFEVHLMQLEGKNYSLELNIQL